MRRNLLFFLTLSFISFFIPSDVFGQTSSPTVNPVKVVGPTITPPDYSKNECSLCETTEFWSEDNGCCKFVFDASGKGSLQLECRQPDIQVCTSSKYCIPARGCLTGGQTLSTFQPAELCGKLVVPDEQAKCLSCMQDEKHLWSAIGCIPINLANLISQTIIPLFLSMGGGVSFLLMLYGIFLVMTSAGDVERLKNGKRHITSAIKGLLILIFALFIVRLIGVTILKIPGMG